MSDHVKKKIEDILKIGKVIAIFLSPARLSQNLQEKKINILFKLEMAKFQSIFNFFLPTPSFLQQNRTLNYKIGVIGGHGGHVWDASHSKGPNSKIDHLLYPKLSKFTSLTRKHSSIFLRKTQLSLLENSIFWMANIAVGV